ncbi:hypothetical protein AAZV13_04G058100 [Glycine max]
MLLVVINRLRIQGCFFFCTFGIASCTFYIASGTQTISNSGSAGRNCSHAVLVAVRDFYFLDPKHCTQNWPIVSNEERYSPSYCIARKKKNQPKPVVLFCFYTGTRI